MRQLILGLFFITSLLLPSSVVALEKQELKQSLSSAIDSVMAIVSDANMSKDEKRVKVYQSIDPLFDFAKMAKLSLGKRGYKSLTKEQQKEYIELFTTKIKSSYADKIELYSDEKIMMGELKKMKKRIHISTYVDKSGEKKEIIYKYYYSKDRGWVIYDVDVLGVSIVKTYRLQFANELKKGSAHELLAKLRAK